MVRLMYSAGQAWAPAAVQVIPDFSDSTVGSGAWLPCVSAHLLDARIFS